LEWFGVFYKLSLIFHPFCISYMGKLLNLFEWFTYLETKF
jgi:hypothetical protein